MNINSLSPVSFKGVYFTQSANEFCSPKAKQKIKKLADDPHCVYQKDVFVQAFKSDDNTDPVVKVEVYNLYRPIYKEGKLESIQRVLEDTYFASAKDFSAVPMTRK